MAHLLDDAFDHHVWATLVVLDVCTELTPEQLASSVPGTYGSILDTLRHLVGSDNWYLHVITHGEVAEIDEDSMDLPQLRAAMEGFGPAWRSVLASAGDGSADTVVHQEDGTAYHAPLSIRIAQALHHGTDHRSQICTGLTALGIEPPGIDLWAYGELTGIVREIPPA